MRIGRVLTIGNILIHTRCCYVYYSVVETSTHWFIVYGLFHPRDWSNESLTQEHENDMERILAIVKKDNSTFGTLQGMITVAHEHFTHFCQMEPHLPTETKL